MSNQKIWTTIDEIFTALNEAECNYIVMCNFECFEQGKVFVNGHDDIDLLCDDIMLARRKFLNLLKHIKRIGDKYV